MAKSIGLEAIAITDHDTLEGIEPALRAGLSSGIEVLPGIELGSYCQGEEIHILGYLVELNNRIFMEKLAFLRETRVYRMERMVEKLRELGFPVNIEMITGLSGPGSVGRPHLAAALIKIGVVGQYLRHLTVISAREGPPTCPDIRWRPVRRSI
jgi:predicted metal-dependent phosphoesterase TrpH